MNGINQVCNSGSATMPVNRYEFERKSGAKILEGYGLTEASPTTHCNPAFAKRKPGSVGIGVPSTEYKVMDLGDGTKEVPTGEMGELVVKGPQVMKGYWNMPEETAVTQMVGFIWDIAKVDEEGYLYIVDRKKDLIIASGYNIYPRDVEEVLYEHPAVQEAVVIGVPDAYRGESVKAVLVLKNDKTANEREIIDYCRANLSAYKVPHFVEFREELPKTMSEILRRALRKNLEIKGFDSTKR
jgi:long-chain acyl-CoA synthetase